MLELLSEGQRLRGAGLDTQTAESAHPEMINMLVYYSLFLSLFINDRGRNDLYGSVGTVDLANSATGAFMLILFIVGHDHLTLEPVEHLKLTAIVGILL